MAGLGHRIGPFELLERVAGGNRTSLYRAVRPDTSRPPRDAAIRMADDPEDRSAAALVEQEYHALRTVSTGAPGNGKYFPQVIGHYAGQAALAMTWLEGATLADLIQARADRFIELNPATSLDILVEIAEAFRRLHGLALDGAPMLHGHLGSQRITVGIDGSIYVTGLGVQPRGRLPAYTAPEQAAGAFVDWRADQWALGAIGVELLLGERLYEGTESAAQAAKEGATTPWVDRIERQWPAIGRVLRRTLAPAAGDRYQNNDILLQELMTARRTLGGLSQRRGLARKVTSLRGRLSAQRPPATPIAPRAAESETPSNQPRPVSPPPHTPIIVASESISGTGSEQAADGLPHHASVPEADPLYDTPTYTGNQAKHIQRPSAMPTPVAPPRPGLSTDMAMSALFTPMPGDPPRPTPAPATALVEEASLHDDLTAPVPRDGRELEPTELVSPHRATGQHGGRAANDPADDELPPSSPLQLQPSEIAGMVFAILFAILGFFYLYSRLWV